MNNAPGPASGKASGSPSPGSHQPPLGPRPLPKPSPIPYFFLLFIIVPFLLAAIFGGSGGGLPEDPGQYGIVAGSIEYDDGRYRFDWIDPSGETHRASTRDVKLQEDDQTFLEVAQDGQAILHLRAEENVKVVQDPGGGYITWIPFPVGGGPVIIDRDQPTYRAPPTTSDGGTIRGSETRDRPVTTSDRRDNPVAISGQNQGTGGGTAATNKSQAPASGQQSGTGTGTAATNKSTPKVGGGSGITRSSSPKPNVSVPRVGGGRIGGRR